MSSTWIVAGVMFAFFLIVPAVLVYRSYGTVFAGLREKEKAMEKEEAEREHDQNSSQKTAE